MSDPKRTLSLCTVYSNKREKKSEAAQLPASNAVSAPKVAIAASASSAASSTSKMKSSDEDSEFKKAVSSSTPFRTRSRSTSIYETSKSICNPKPDHPESKALFFADPDGHLGPDEPLRESYQRDLELPRRVTRKISVSEDLNDLSDGGSRIDNAYLPKVLTNQCPDGLRLRTSANEVKVLVLYTGGTIGMTCKGGVYSPEPDFLVRKLRQLPTLHDSEYVKKFMTEEDGEDVSGLPLALPISRSGKRIIYLIYEYDPLLDSSNITMVDWVRIANDIKLSYANFDGFVVLHGTDTMSYTASALSFMLENLGKPVVLTGSQIPIPEMRSDGRDNLLGALYMAGHYCIPEVCLYFNCKLMRGNRTSKVSTNRLDAFDTPNFPALATLEVDVQVNWDIILDSPPEKFCVHPTLNRHVGILRLFPSISTELVLNYLKPPMAGVILQTYGMGNAPDNREDIIEALREATRRGVIIINISQCPRGEVAATYAVSAALVEAGVIGGGDMTPEAGLAKLSYVLSKDEWSNEQKRKMMMKSLRGEVRVPKSSTASKLASAGILAKLTAALNLKGEEQVQYVKKAFLPSLMGTAVKTGDKETLASLHEEMGTFNVPMVDDRTPLHIAAIEGRLDLAAYMLEHGAALHVRDSFGRSPLLDAVERKHSRIVKLFRKAGAHLSFSSSTALALAKSEAAAATTAAPTGRRLSASEAAAFGSSFGVQVCSAVWNRDLKLVNCWLIAGVDPNDPDYAGTRPLHVAARALVHPDILLLLLNYGAKTYYSDGNGKTPLDILSAVREDARTERWTEIHRAISTWDNESHPIMTSPSGLWRLSEGDDEENEGKGGGGDGGGGRGKRYNGPTRNNEDDDTDRAVEESLSTDDDDDKRISFTLDDEVEVDGTIGRVRRNTVKEAEDADATDK